MGLAHSYEAGSITYESSFSCTSSAVFSLMARPCLYRIWCEGFVPSLKLVLCYFALILPNWPSNIEEYFSNIVSTRDLRSPSGRCLMSVGFRQSKLFS